MKRAIRKFDSDKLLAMLLFFSLTCATTEPEGPKAKRDTNSSAKYRRNNPEEAKRSRRLSSFRYQGKTAGIIDPQEMEEYVNGWVSERQEKHA
jgi:hypothetical protein